MKTKILFFASVREQLGISQEILVVPDDIRTVGDLRQYLIKRKGVWANALSYDQPICMACQFEKASEKTKLVDNCEVAFFPPVTGG